MSQFGALQVTANGILLLQKAQTGVQLQFSRCAVGDGSLPVETDITTLTALINEKLSLGINLLEIMNGQATIRTTISNDGLLTGFYVREIGLFANDPDVGEILYAVANAGDTADYIPEYGGAEVVEIIYDLVTILSNAENVTAVYDDSLAFVTRPELNAHIDDFEDHINDLDPHGAVSTAVGSRLMIRDAAGRVQVTTPDAAADVATKGYVDGQRIQVAIMTGAISHGGTIPLPLGYTQAQCRWMVSIREQVAGDHTSLFCYADGDRKVYCYDSTDGGGLANYMIIGVK